MRFRALSRQTSAVLATFVGEPLRWRHGYELARRTGLSSGSLYPILIRLHERGMLHARWEEPERLGLPPRHAYRLTPEGLVYARELHERPQTRRRSDPGEVPA